MRQYLQDQRKTEVSFRYPASLKVTRMAGGPDEIIGANVGTVSHKDKLAYSCAQAPTCTF